MDNLRKSHSYLACRDAVHDIGIETLDRTPRAVMLRVRLLGHVMWREL